MKPPNTIVSTSALIIAALTSVLFSAPAAVITNGLIAYYEFNGNSIDETGHGHDGTAFGATLTSNRFGQANSAYNFNGLNNYISIPNSSGFAVTDFSVAAWVQTSDKSDYKYITSTYGGASSSAEWYNLNIMPTGTARLQTDPGSTSNPPFAIGTTDVADGNWHFLVGTRDTSTGLLKIYVDGNLQRTEADISTEELNPAVDFRIGVQHGFSDRYFNGNIDDVRIYDRALTAGDINTLYAIPEPSTAVLLSGVGVLLFSFRKKLFR